MKSPLKKETKHYQKSLKKLRKEQKFSTGSTIDDREQDLLSDHYKKIKELQEKMKK